MHEVMALMGAWMKAKLNRTVKSSEKVWGGAE